MIVLGLHYCADVDEVAAMLDEMRPMLNSILSDLLSIKRNMTILNESLHNLTNTVELYRNETASELDHLQKNLVEYSDGDTPTDAPTTLCCGSEQLEDSITLLLRNSYGYVSSPADYTCNGEGGWRRVFFLNMTDETTQCPVGWKHFFQSDTSACGRRSDGSHTCDSVRIPVRGATYTKVCGLIKAYQVGSTDAFQSYDEGAVTTINGAYVGGVSLTHGNPRQHIWTFAAGIRESHQTRNDACPCDATVNITVPAFVNNSYFCESGHNTDSSTGFNRDDPLWDGAGCSASSTCCSFNNPPYFLQQLPAPTHNDIEARICHKDVDDDTPVEFMEVYVK